MTPTRSATTNSIRWFWVKFKPLLTAERVNGRLKDEFGARNLWVRGDAKVFCHLMFGVLALSIDQLMRLVT